ncbi:uncharacterized protein LOC131929094 [Physella acuta]|uniref:uncharacterized protein LOC131929094 n=1 Tax=Physella acuta TaxID=109671 RepID=UPI0027DBCFA3|nr:uncharacterized protein LOC131929094 [Physella acuta]
MKEQTYGWYPSVQDIYRPKGRPSSYHLECLYKYGNSMYYQSKAVPPAPELLVRGVSGASPPPTPQDLRRSKSVPIPKFTKSTKIHIPTPSECWAAHRKLQETQWGVANDTTDFSSRPPTEMCWPLPKEKQQEMLNQQRQMQTAPQNAWGLRSKTSPDLYGSGSVLEWPAAHHNKEERPDSARVTVEKMSRDKKSRPATSFVRSSQGNQRPTTAKPAVVPAPPSGKNTHR